jgi:exosome complex RNA-binding protein Rrp42 (RNase PH superfamily)
MVISCCSHVSDATYVYREILADPNESEESISEAKIAIVLDENRELCNVWKLGGALCTADDMRSCIATARERHRELMEIFHAAIDGDRSDVQ